MCDTKFSIYLYYIVRLESVHVQMVIIPWVSGGRYILTCAWYGFFSLGMILALFHFVSLSCFYHFLCFT